MRVATNRFPLPTTDTPGGHALRDALTRVAAFNADPTRMAYINAVALLPRQPDDERVHLAVSVAPRPATQPWDAHEYADQSGRTFRTCTARDAWWMTEAIRAVKARRRQVVTHGIQAVLFEDEFIGPHIVVYVASDLDVTTT